MGKKTAIKRQREAENQSIRSKKSTSNRKGGGLSRKQRQEFEDYGTLDAVDAQFNSDREEGFDAAEEKSWTFNAKGEVIESTESSLPGLNNEIQTTTQKYQNLPIMKSSSALLNPLESLDTKLNSNKSKNNNSSLNKLLGQLKKNSKRSILDIQVKPKVNSVKKERETGQNEKIKKENAKEKDSITEEYIDHMNDDSLIKSLQSESKVSNDEFEDDMDDEEEMETDDEDINNVSIKEDDHFFKHFGDNSYGLEHLEVLSALAKGKKWQANPIESSLENDYGKLVRLSVEEDEFKIPFDSSSYKSFKTLDQWAIKYKIQEGWRKANKTLLEENGLNPNQHLFTPFQAQLFHQLNQYQDVMYPHRTIANTPEIRSVYLLHALNHAIKVRKEITNNNSQLIMARKEGKPLDDVRDGSYVRPKVLILVPFRSVAYKVVNFLMQLIGAEVENKNRFLSEFHMPPEEDRINKNKPDDFVEAFSGHNDDCFRLGIKLTKGSFKLYANFYDSDILIASPLGLRLIIGAPGDKKRDYDFLSSIEVLCMDQVEHMMMQNWDHVTHLFSHLNLVPVNPHGCDFSRVKQYVLNDKLPTLRQNIFLSSFLSPELLNVFNKYSLNVAGKIRYKLESKDQLAKVRTSVKQVFHKVRCTNFKDADDLRFKYFTETLIPYLNKNVPELNHTLIFIPSYFDFTRIRNYFDSQDMEFGVLSEYSSVSDSSHDRDYFKQGIHHFLLYTERAQFFRRYHLKGIQRVIFYGLPDHAQYYSEIINMIEIPPEMKLIHSDIKANSYPYFSLSLVTQFDQLKWERVIGSDRIENAMKGKREILTFL